MRVFNTSLCVTLLFDQTHSTPLPHAVYKPSVNSLTQLGVIKTVSSQWRQLGLRLGQSTNALDNYDRQAMLNNDTCCEWVFNHWCDNGGGSYPVTWKGVYDVLCAINHRMAADDMKSALACKGVDV
jgi:hypothetical protein